MENKPWEKLPVTNRVDKKIKNTLVNKTIIVEKKPNHCIAYLKDHKEILGCGKSSYAAIGDLICGHNDIFQINIIIKEDT